MSIQAIKGIVENGKVRLIENIALPEKTNVYVIVGDPFQSMSSHIPSPRLADPLKADDFRKQIVEIPRDASL